MVYSFDLQGRGATPNFATALTTGFQSGQKMVENQQVLRANQQKQQNQAALSQLVPQIMQGDKGALQQALQIDPTGQAVTGVLSQMKSQQDAQSQQEKKRQEFLGRGAYDVLNAPPQMQQAAKDRFIQEGIKSGMLPQEYASEIGTPLDEEDMMAMQSFVRGAQSFSDVTRSAEPLSNAAKIQADIDAGRLSPDIGGAALSKETTPTSPLVKVDTAGETAGQKEIAKARAGRIASIRNLGDTSNIVSFGANRLQEAIDRNNVGSLSDIKALGVELADSFGLPVKPELLTKAKDVRAVERVLARGALDTLESLKGSTSNKDLDFAQKVSGRVNQGKASLQELSDLMKASSSKAQQISDALVEADLAGATLQEQDALIAQLKKELDLENIYNNIKTQREEQQADKSVGSLPAGAVQIGTSDGKPVFQTPDGRTFIQE